MKLPSALRCVRNGSLAASLAALLGAHCASAATNVTWDVTPGTVGAGDSAITGGVGTWDTTNGNWTVDAGVNNLAWNNGNNDTAIFGGTAGIVTLGAPITVGGVTFNDNAGYSITANTLTFGAAGSITANVDATIASTLAGNVGLTKTGAGTLTLGTRGSYSGPTVVSGGVLTFTYTTARTLPTLPATAGLGLQLQLDASNLSSITKDGAETVTAWNDLSGNGVNCRAGAGTPKYVAANSGFGGLPTINFANNYFNCDVQNFMKNGAPYTILAVAAKNSNGSNNYFFGSSGGNTNRSMHYGWRTDTQFTLAQWGNDINSSAVPAFTGSEVACETTGKFNPAIGGGHFLYFNGTQVASNTSTQGMLSTMNQGEVGRGQNAAFTGDIGEILVFNTALSDTDRATFETYLQNKWMPVLLPYVNLLPPATALSIAPSSLVDLNGITQTVASLTDYTPGSSGNVTNGNASVAATLTINPTSGSATFSGVIAGGGGLGTINLAKSGAGTWVLAGPNSYSGSTTINGGTLQMGGASVLPSATVVVLANTAGAVLDLNGRDLTIGSLAGGGTTGGNVTLGSNTLTVGGNNANTQYSGVISSSAGVTGVSLYKIGTGNLQLSGANTFTGKIYIDGGNNNGKLIVGNDNGTGGEAKLGPVPATFQADSITIANGGHLVVYASGDDTSNLSANRGIYLAAGTQYIDSGGGDFRIAGTISGPGSLFHSNQGSWGWNGRRMYLDASSGNTYTGDTWWDATGTESNYGGIDMNGHPLALQNSALRADSIASYLGVATSGGVLQLGGLLDGTGTVRSLQDITGNATFTGLVLNTYVSGVTKTYTNVIGTGNHAGTTLTKTGAGTQALNGANAYTGKTTIKNGVLSINTLKNAGGGASSLGNPALANATIAIGDLATTATLTYTGTGDTTDRVIDLAGTTGGATLDQSGSGDLTFGSDFIATGAGAKTLTLQGSTAANGIIGGAIVDSSGGATALTKTGTGNWILNGVNTFSGVTTLNGGTLTLGNNSTLTNSPLNYVAGTLAFSGGINTPVIGGLTGSTSLTLAGNVTGLTLNPGSGVTTTYSGLLGETTPGMSLTKSGSGTQVFAANTTYTGSTAVNLGKLYLNGATNATTAISVAADSTLGGAGSAGSATAVVDDAGILEAGYNGAGTLTLNGLTFSNTAKVAIANVGNYNINAAVDVLSSGGLTAGGAAGSVTIALSGTPPSGVGVAHLLHYAGAIGGTGFDAFSLDTSALNAGPRAVFELQDNAGFVDLHYSLDHLVWTGAGDGTWITTSASPVTPPTNWKLNSNNSAANFSLSDAVVFDDTVGSGKTTVDVIIADAQPASVAFNNTAKNYTLQGDFGIAGGAALSKSGTGTLTLASNNPYTGGTTITGGTVQVGTGSTTGSIGSGAIANDGSLMFNRTSLLTLANAISGTGTITQSGTGELVLSGSNSHGGDTVLTNGTLTLGSATALGGTTGKLIINGGTLDSSVASLALTANNAQTWNSDVVFKGTQDLNLGAGAVSLGSAPGTRTVTVDASTLSVGGVIADGTATALAKAGPGTLVLAGANTYGGGTVVNAGTVTVNDGATLGAGTGPLAVNNPNTGAGTDVVLNLNGSVSVGSLSGTVAIPASGANNATINTVADKTLTVNQTAAGTYAGVIAGGGKLVKAGGSLLTLSGINTYSGGTQLAEGTLSINTLSALGNSGTITFSGGTLQYTGHDSVTTTRFGISGGSQTFDITQSDANFTVVQQYTGSTIIKKGAGTLTFGGDVGWDHANFGNGVIAVDNGTVVLDARVHSDNGNNPLFHATFLTVNDVQSGATLKLGTTYNTIELAFSNTFHMSGGTYDINGVVNNGSAQIDGTGTIINNGATNATVNIFANLNNTFSGNIVDGTRHTGLLFGNVGGFVGNPAAVWTLAGNNTYSGVTLVGAGTLRAGSATACSPGSAYTVNATLDLAGFSNSVGSLAGTGNVTLGTATLTMSGTNATPVAFTGSITGAGGVVKTGGGTQTLSGSVGYSGDTIVSEGTLNLGAVNPANAGSTVTIDSGATLELSFTASNTVKQLYIGTELQPAGDYIAMDNPGSGTKIAQITGTGTLHVTSGAAGAGYANWASDNGLDGSPGKEAGFDADPELDGVPNGLEWILGGVPLVSDPSVLPAASGDATTGLTLTFTRNEASIGQVTLVVEYDTDLDGTWDGFVTIGATSSPVDGVTIDTDATPDAVTVTIPASKASNGTLFARLRAIQP